MIDFVVHSEKVESSPEGNKIDSDQTFLRSSVNIIEKCTIKFKQRKPYNWFKEYNKKQNAFAWKQ